tara:strand:- start:1729 stop:2211 length:483 start_codon:yes stop_codon:yes gene_type:complete
MNKNIIATLLVLLISLTSCGYQPIFSSKSINNNADISINNITFKNKNDVNNIFLRKLKFFQKQKENSNQFDIILNISKTKKIISKNKVGNPEVYNIEIITDLSITRKGSDEIIYSSSLESNKNYNNLENKFDLKQEENTIISNLVDEMVNEIISAIFSSQ